MNNTTISRCLRELKPLALAMTIAVVLCAGGVNAEAPSPGSDSNSAASSSKWSKLDLSGRKRVGIASFYASSFNGRKMADGTRMDPTRDVAASKTLPLGTTAKVTNLETGRSAVVTIQDRGPYVKGRIVDLTPATAEKVGISRQDGLARVEVTPLTIPMPDGTRKMGDAASMR